MQGKKSQTAVPRIPEYYLYWTYQRADLLCTPLRTLEGLRLEIVEPGRRNRDDGPDYLNALLKIGGVIYRGDVEFHIRWQDWFGHGHQADRRYSQVILHVLWEVPDRLPPVLSRRFHHVALSGSLKHPVDRWMQIMGELNRDEASVSEKALTRLPTADRLEKLAWTRFLRKCDQMRQWVQAHGWEMATYLGLAKALGYSKNSEPFVSLVRQLPPGRLLKVVHPLQRSPVLFWLLLTTQAGLFDRPFRTAPQARASLTFGMIDHVRRQFSSLLPVEKQSIMHWHFSRLRPFNNPYFRLAGYAQILFHYQEQSLFQFLLDIVMNRFPLPRMVREVEQSLSLPLSPAFASFFQELLGVRQLPRHSMGGMRCRQFILNIVLPLSYVWAHTRKSPGFRTYLKALYFHFPEIDINRMVRFYQQQSSQWPRHRAYIQQGLLEYSQQQILPSLIGPA